MRPFACSASSSFERHHAVRERRVAEVPHQGHDEVALALLAERASGALFALAHQFVPKGGLRLAGVDRAHGLCSLMARAAESDFTFGLLSNP
jgi:hypothetical protein